MLSIRAAPVATVDGSALAVGMSYIYYNTIRLFMEDDDPYKNLYKTHMGEVAGE